MCCSIKNNCVSVTNILDAKVPKCYKTQHYNANWSYTVSP